MTFRSHTAGPSRVFDHLYDPIYTTSDCNDIWRNNCSALSKSAPIHIFPIFRSMFTDLPQKPRNFHVLQKNPLPFDPTPEQSTDIHFDSAGLQKVYTVTGSDRTKFFANPLSNVKTVNVGLMADEYDMDEVSEEIKYKTTGCQTTYRESSAQTNPYLPEGFLKNENQDIPEIVHVADLLDSTTYPGLKEVEIIERARNRRKWELSLPSKMPKDIPERVVAVEAFEWEEWMNREKNINDCQLTRMQIVADLVAKREKENEEVSIEKLLFAQRRVYDERKKQKEHLLRNYQRSMRKLDFKQKQLLFKDRKEDAVVAHYDKKMEFALPKLRLDLVSKRRNNIEYSNEFEERFSLLEKANATVGDLRKFLNPRREIWLPKEPCKEVEKGVWSDQYLKELHETLKKFRHKTDIQRSKPKCLVSRVSIEEAKDGITTPTIPRDDDEEAHYQDTILIQKIIKGRAIQKMLHEGKDKCQSVIDEIRSTHSISCIQNLYPKGFDQLNEHKRHVLTEYKRIEEQLQNDEIIQEELKRAEGTEIGNLLNTLDQELNQLQGEKKAHALYLLAEHERARREARVQFEENPLATKYNETDWQVSKAQYETVTMFLENVLIGGIDRIADENSRKYIRNVAKRIDIEAHKSLDVNDVIDFEKEHRVCSTSQDAIIKLSKSVDDAENPEKAIVKEMLKEFMVPEICNRILGQQKINEQRKNLLAAHQALYAHSEITPLEEVVDVRIVCEKLVNEVISIVEDYFMKN